MRRILVSICLCCLWAAPAAARMYQWHNPATGTTQLSGTPPAWYRSTDTGPRVYVFDNNQLVDDTGIAVSEAQREALRAEAFGQHPTQEAAALPVTPPPSSPARAAATPPAPRSDTTPATDGTAPATSPDAAAAGKAASLKALIDAWDQRQIDQARSLLEMLPGEAGAAPAQP